MSSSISSCPQIFNENQVITRWRSERQSHPGRKGICSNELVFPLSNYNFPSGLLVCFYYFLKGNNFWFATAKLSLSWAHQLTHNILPHINHFGFIWRLVKTSFVLQNLFSRSEAASGLQLQRSSFLRFSLPLSLRISPVWGCPVSNSQLGWKSKTSVTTGLFKHQKYVIDRFYETKWDRIRWPDCVFCKEVHGESW